MNLKLTKAEYHIIGSDNGLSPILCQAIIWSEPMQL